MTTDQLLTMEQVAEWLQVTVGTLRDWRARGTPRDMSPLPVIKVGGAVRYRREDVEAWLAANTETSRRLEPLPRRGRQRRIA